MLQHPNKILLWLSQQRLFFFQLMFLSSTPALNTNYDLQNVKILPGGLFFENTPIPKDARCAQNNK